MQWCEICGRMAKCPNCDGGIMTKAQAIEWIKEIQGGDFDRNEMIAEIPRGLMAVEHWNNSKFSYGMEYGAILTLMKIYGIKKDEL